MKQIYFLLLVSLLAVQTVSAVTPDHKYFWLLDKAFEKLQEVFNPSLKQVHYKERIEEAKQMREQGKYVAADAALAELPQDLPDEIEAAAQHEHKQLLRLYTELEDSKRIILAKHSQFRDRFMYQSVSKDIFQDFDQIGILIRDTPYSYTLLFEEGVLSDIIDGVADDVQLVIELDRGKALSIVQHIQADDDVALFREFLNAKLPPRLRAKVYRAGLDYGLTAVKKSLPKANEEKT